MRSIARLRAVVTIQAPGVCGRPVARPALEGRRECVLHRVLGELEVAEDAREDADGASPFLAEDTLDLRLHAAVIAEPGGSRWRPVPAPPGSARRAGSPRRGREAPMRKTPPTISFVSANGPSVTMRSPSRTRTTFAVVASVELLARHVRIGLAELLEERDPLRHLRRAERRLLLLGEVDPGRVVVVDEQRVVHS